MLWRGIGVIVSVGGGGNVEAEFVTGLLFGRRIDFFFHGGDGGVC